MGEGPLTRRAALQSRTKAYLENALSSNTRRAYRVAWGQWDRWAGRHGVPPLPAPDVAVADYLSAQASRWAPATLAVHCAALSCVHRTAGLPDPMASPLVSTVLRGIRSAHGRPQTGAAPLRLAELFTITRALGQSSRDIRDRALLLVGWWGAFRRSELTGLHMSDVLDEPEGLVVTVRRSKTDQEGRGLIRMLARQPEGRACPASAWCTWERHLDARFEVSDGAAFRALDRHNRIGQALTGRSVSRILQRRAREAGFTGSYSAHSLRVGFVTECAARGLPEHRIAAHTGHQSVRVLRRAIREGTRWTNSLTASLATG